jgi:hypothetical protein
VCCAQVLADHYRVGAFGVRGQHRRQLLAVLAVLVERVGWRAGAHVAGPLVVPRPRVGAAGVDARRQVVDHPDRHAGRERGALVAAELVVDQPLPPRAEVDAPGEFGARVGDRVGARVAQPGGPLRPGGAVALGQRADGGEVGERVAAPVAGGGQCGLARLGSRAGRGRARAPRV